MYASRIGERATRHVPRANPGAAGSRAIALALRPTPVPAKK